MSQSIPVCEKTALRNPDLLGSLAVLLATAFWGTSGVFITLILATQEVSVLALAFWRALMTFLVLLVGLGLLQPTWLQVKRGDLVWFGMLGGSISVMQLLWSVAVLLNGPAVATVQQAAMPAIVAVAAWLIWREPLTGRKSLAILLTFVGTAFVSGLNVLGRADLSLSGLLAGLGLATFYAGWNIVIKKVRRGYNPLTTLTYQFGFGALMLLPFQFFTPQPQSLPASVLLHFVGLVGIATVGGFFIYTFAVGRLQASVATILAMAEIPIVAVYAYVLLGERMTIDQILGSVLVAAGVLMLSWRRKKRVPSQ
ncbi:MAG: DMT family transporter [Anaerolineae bacterium]|jgi:drug/metabolite transporter (DMT)-like permease